MSLGAAYDNGSEYPAVRISMLVHEEHGSALIILRLFCQSKDDTSVPPHCRSMGNSFCMYVRLCLKCILVCRLRGCLLQQTNGSCMHEVSYHFHAYVVCNIGVNACV